MFEWRDPRRRPAIVMIVGGLAIAAIGLVAILAGGGDDEEASRRSDSSSTPAATSPATSTFPTPAPTTDAEPAATSTSAAPTTAPATTGTTTATATATTTTTAPTSATTTTATTTTTTLSEGTIGEFLAAVAEAVTTGDVGFLTDRLHPAVYERYGLEQCATYLERIAGATSLSITVLDTAPPATGPYERDGITTLIDDLIVVRIERIDGGDTVTTTETRVATVDGRLRWFTDCGEPLEP